MTSPIPTVCDMCGKSLKRGYKRIRVDKHVNKPTNTTYWLTDNFKRYYCYSCAEVIKKCIRKCEVEQCSPQ